MLYQRKISKLIEKRIEDKEIIVLTGMRRTGKTTLYQMLFDRIKSSNKVFLDLENPLDQKIFEEKDYNEKDFLAACCGGAETWYTVRNDRTYI